MTIEKIINVSVKLSAHRQTATVEWTSGRPGALGYLFWAQGYPDDDTLVYNQVVIGPLFVPQNRFIAQVTGLDPTLPYSFYVETVRIDGELVIDGLTGLPVTDNDGDPTFTSDATTVVAEMPDSQYLLNPIAPSGVVPISGGFPLAGPIQLGCDRAINLTQGTVPNMFDAFDDWMQNIIVEKVGKLVSSGTAFQAVETTVRIPFRGLMVPEQGWQLTLKPVAQRTWKYYKLYAEAQLPLFTDDVILWQGGQYRVTSLTDWSLYGYFEYELAQDWTTRGPLDATSTVAE